MKRLLSLLLTILMLCSILAACGGSDTSPTQGQSNGSTIDFDIDYDFDSPGFSYNPTISTETAGNIMDFEFTVPNITYEVKPIESANLNSILSFDFPSNDFSYHATPVEVSTGEVTFEIPNFDISYNTDSFDVEAFTSSSSANFTDSDLETLSGMAVEQVVEIAEIRTNLLADLSHAFTTSGLSVTVNETTGEIILDSSVLFNVNESTISEEGKVLLRQFLSVYTTVVFSGRYNDYVSTLLVEGHTDTNGSYDYNLTLSQARADSVLAFCLSEESGITGDCLTALESMMEAIGYSYDYPVYDAEGNVDMAASRRVSFRFLISVS